MGELTKGFIFYLVTKLVNSHHQLASNPGSPDLLPPLRVVGEGWGGLKQSRDAFHSCGKLRQPHPGPSPTSQGRERIVARCATSQGDKLRNTKLDNCPGASSV